jgi:putative ABC transport system substrate-binding protein
MRRRRVIALLAGTALAWPIAGRAQVPERMRRIGVLMIIAEHDPEAAARVAAFRRGLEELGWTEGRNLRIDWRWGGGDAFRMRDYAAELVGLAPDLLVANGTPGLAALRQATQSIPIVFVIVNDPVGQGFIANLARPGGNITGFTFFDYPMIEKSLELLKELAPGIVRVAFIYNPENTPYYADYLGSLAAAPRAVAVEVTGAPVRSDAEIEAAIAGLGGATERGLIVPPDAFTLVRRDLILRLAAQHRLPAIYAYRQFVTEGGLLSYGPDTTEIFRRSASYVDRILKGAKPGELPVQQPTKFEVAVNLNTAKALGLLVPQSLLARADEVIE